MPLVKYIGNKEFKDDNVAGTGVVWLSNGDVQSVPYGAWAKLAKHPGVWALVEEAKADSTEQQLDAEYLASQHQAKTEFEDDNDQTNTENDLNAKRPGMANKALARATPPGQKHPAQPRNPLIKAVV